MKQKFENKVLLNKYQLTQEIGLGQQGSVFYGTELNTNPIREVAVKIVNMTFLKPKERELLQNEITVLGKLNSKHIIRLYDHFQQDGNTFLVMEYCNGGTLEKVLKEQKDSLTDRFKKDMFKQILLAFKELHSKNIMHRDIKIQNILLHNGELKLGDFGFCKQLAKQEDICNTLLGTRGTMAPELLEFKPYGIEAEMYSIGVVFYLISKQKFPFVGPNPFSLVASIKEGKADYAGLSEELVDLLKKMLTYDPKKRLPWKDLLKHPFFVQDGEEMFLNSKIVSDEKDLNNYEDFYKALKIAPENYEVILEEGESQQSSSNIVEANPYVKQQQQPPAPLNRFQIQQQQNPTTNQQAPLLPQALPFQNKLDKPNNPLPFQQNQGFIPFQNANLNQPAPQFNQFQPPTVPVFMPSQNTQNVPAGNDFKPIQSGNFQWGQKQGQQSSQPFLPQPLQQPQQVLQPPPVNPDYKWMEDSSQEQIIFQQQQISQLQAKNKQCSDLIKRFQELQQNYAYLLLAAKRLVSLDANSAEMRITFSIYVFPAVMVLKEKVSILKDQLQTELDKDMYLPLKRDQPQDYNRLKTQLSLDSNYLDYIGLVCEASYEQSSSSQYDLFRNLIKDCILNGNRRAFDAQYQTQLKLILIDVLIDIASPNKIRTDQLSPQNKAIINKLIKEACSYLILSCFIERPNINILEIEKNLLEGNFQFEMKQKLNTLIQEVSPQVKITDLEQEEDIQDQQYRDNLQKERDIDNFIAKVNANKDYQHPIKNQFIRRFKKIP